MATLYVGNLPYSMTEAQLAEQFKNYGASNARIIEGRGFGFVDIDAEIFGHVDESIALIVGHGVAVQAAQPHHPREVFLWVHRSAAAAARS